MKIKIVRIISAFGITGIIAMAITYSVMFFRQENSILSDPVLDEAPGEFVRLQHGLVHYRLEGPSAGKLVLLIPGGGISGCEIFDKVLPEFHQRGYKTLTYDLYGRGYSARPTVNYSPELFQDQINQLLDSLTINDSLQIISMSMGAIVGIDYVNRHPEKVSKLVFIDPSLAGQFTPNIALRIPVLSDFLMTVYWYPRAAENQRKEFVDQKIFEDYKKRLLYFMNFKGYKYTNYSTWFYTLNQDKLPLLDRIQPNKVLLLYGDRDPYFSEDLVTVFLSHYPTLKHSAIPNTGHIPHLEKPQEVSQVIFDFLK